MENRDRMWRSVGAGLVLGLALILSGCDYWPPALQTQIEQLRSEVQVLTAEKTQLQNQMAMVAKAKDDLQMQVEELSRANRDKSALINSLQNTVTSLQQRLAKSSKASATKPASTKAGAKTTSKSAKTSKTAPAKKK